MSLKQVINTLPRSRASYRGLCINKYGQRLFSIANEQIQHKIGIFITGGPPAHIKQFGDYGDMMINMLSDDMNINQQNEKWFKYYCMDNEFPSNDEINELTGIVITGSRYDAHGNDEWICSLRDKIRYLYNNKNNKNEYIRILGICFGHQIVSNSLKGESGPSTKGWQLGIQNITFNEQFYEIFPNLKQENISSLPILKLHQDQVHSLPTNAILLASSCTTPIEMYRIGNNVLCVQGHPEFDTEYLKSVVQLRNKDGIIPDENMKQCFDSLKDENEHKQLKLWNRILRSWLINEN